MRELLQIILCLSEFQLMEKFIIMGLWCVVFANVCFGFRVMMVRLCVWRVTLLGVCLLLVELIGRCSCGTWMVVSALITLKVTVELFLVLCSILIPRSNLWVLCLMILFDCFVLASISGKMIMRWLILAETIYPNTPLIVILDHCYVTC